MALALAQGELCPIFPAPQFGNDKDGMASSEDQLVAETKGKLHLEEFKGPAAAAFWEGQTTQAKQPQRRESYIVELHQDAITVDLYKDTVAADAQVTEIAQSLMEQVCGSGGSENINGIKTCLFYCELTEDEAKTMRSRKEVLAVDLDLLICPSFGAAMNYYGWFSDEDEEDETMSSV